LLQRASTQVVGTTDISFLVLQHIVHDSKSLASLASHQKRSSWKIALLSDLRPMEFDVSVDKRTLSYPEVSVSKDGEQLFPESNQKQAKMNSDFIWTQPTRGKLKDLGKKGVYLAKPLRSSGDRWLKAVIVEQHDDQTFDADAWVPSNDEPGKFNEVHLANIPVQNIRKVGPGGGERVEIPRRNLVLTVPAKEPLKATLSVDDGSGNPETEQDIGELLGRVTPRMEVLAAGSAGEAPVVCKKSNLELHVSKDGKKVSASASQPVVEHFLNSEVRAVKQEFGMDSHKWIVQLGPYAEHTISLERRQKGSPILTLVVDGDILLQCSGEDLAGVGKAPGSYWKCQFRFLGEKSINWNLDTSGIKDASGDKQVVSKKIKVEYECNVIFEESKRDLTAARFSIDDQDFKELPEKDERQESNHSVMKDFELDTFASAYRLEVPKPKIAPKELKQPTGVLGGFFAACCSTGADASSDGEVMVSRKA
jgi:hypothetical protein